MKPNRSYPCWILSLTLVLAGCSNSADTSTAVQGPAPPPPPTSSSAAAGSSESGTPNTPPPPPLATQYIAPQIKPTTLVAEAYSEFVFAGPSSDFVAVGKVAAGGPTNLIDLSTMEKKASILDIKGRAGRVAVSGDGKWLARAVNGTPVLVEIWSFESGELVHKIEAHPSPITIEILEFVGAHLVTAKIAVGGKLFEIWDHTTGKKTHEFTGPSLISREARAVSPDGELLAFYSDKKIRVVEIPSGNTRAELALPEQPFSYADCRAIEFTRDGTELGGVFYNNQETQLLSWNVGSTEIAVHHNLPGDVRYAVQGGFSYVGKSFTWLPDASAALLYGHAMVDRATGRMVWMLPSPEDDVYPGPRKFLDNDHLLITSGKTFKAKQFQILTIPWSRIDGSLKGLADSGVDAHVKPGKSVTLDVEVTDVRSGTPPETKEQLTRALSARLKKDGLNVAESQPLILKVRYSEDVGRTLNEVVKDGGPGPFGQSFATGKTIEGTKAVCDVSYSADGKVFWSTRMLLDPRHITVLGQANQDSARQATFRMIMAQLIRQPLPYFVPKDKKLALLPCATPLISATAASSSAGQATPRKTTRGQTP